MLFLAGKRRIKKSICDVLRDLRADHAAGQRQHIGIIVEPREPGRAGLGGGA